SQPPTDRNDAVLAYDSVNQMIVAVIRANDATDGKEVAKGHLETWAYDAGKNTWTSMKPKREPDGWGNRARVITYVPDQNLFLMDIYVHPAQRVPDVEREHQIWTYRFAEAKPDLTPRPPTGIQITTMADSAALQWQSSASPDVTEYSIHRGEGTQPWLVEFKQVSQVDKTKTTYVDTGLKRGTTYFYCVRAVAKGGQASRDSVKVRTQ